MRIVDRGVVVMVLAMKIIGEKRNEKNQKTSQRNCSFGGIAFWRWFAGMVTTKYKAGK